MKNHYTFWEHLGQHSKQFKKISKGIITTTFVVGTLLTPWKTATAHDVYTDFNSDGDMVLAMGTPYKKAPGFNPSAYRGTATTADAGQILYGISMYGLQTNAYAPSLLHQRTLNFINTYESEAVVDEHGFLVVFSW